MVKVITPPCKQKLAYLSFEILVARANNERLNTLKGYYISYILSFEIQVAWVNKELSIGEL